MWRGSKFQIEIAQSRLNLPVCGIFALLMCGVNWSLPFLLFTAFILLETNNEFQILRVRSRMVTGFWLLLVGIVPFLHEPGISLFCAACMALSFRLLFRCYEKQEPVENAFHSFLLLGLCLLGVPSLLLLVPMHLFYLAVFLRSISLRMLCASLIGLMLPFWVVLGWSAVVQDYVFFNLWLEGIKPLPLDADTYSIFPVYYQHLWGFVTLVGMVAILHQLIYKYDDKIKTRMLLYIFVGDSLVIWLLMTLQPHLFSVLMGALSVSIAPLMAHYFAQTRSLASNAFTVVTLILFMYFTWTLSQTSY